MESSAIQNDVFGNVATRNQHACLLGSYEKKGDVICISCDVKREVVQVPMGLWASREVKFDGENPGDFSHSYPFITSPACSMSQLGTSG